MEKILLAVGFRELEDYLKSKLRNEFMFVGTTVYREGIIRSIGQKNPDIVIIRETLDGNENIMTIVYEIRSKYPKIRVVFIGGKREPGDALLANLVNYGIYDILHGEKIKAQEVVALIRKPNEYKNVQHLQPVPVLDENRNAMIFQAPSAIVQEREVIKEIYIEQGGQQPSFEETPPTVTPFVKKEEEVIEPTPMPISELKIVSPKVIPVTESVEKPKQETPKRKARETEAPKETNKKSFFEKMITRSEDSAPFNEQMISTTKQKIITFMGSKGGVGNTSIAFNTAFSLAQKGLKTIYIEFNDRTPSVSYWYEIDSLEDGIDSALISLEHERYEKVDEAIIRSSELKNKEGLMQKNYKKFPNTLDFMFYSHRYRTRELDEGYEEEIDMTFSKELFLYLMFQCDYDFIILDVPSDINHPVTSNALIYSNKVLSTITQDVATIGYSIYKMNELKKRGINIDKKLYYIINKFEKADLSLKEIEDWIQTKNIETVPVLNKEFVNANFIGLPVLINTKNSGLKVAFQKIEKIIV